MKLTRFQFITMALGAMVMSLFRPKPEPKVIYRHIIGDSTTWTPIRGIEIDKLRPDLIIFET